MSRGEAAAGPAVLTVEDARGRRRFRPEDFPLLLAGAIGEEAIGGTAPGDEAPGGLPRVEVPGLPPGRRLAYLGIDRGDVFLQPAEEAGETLACNGEAVGSSRWLHPGDELTLGPARAQVERTSTGLRLTVEDASTSGAQAPPLPGRPTLTPPPRDLDGPRARDSGGPPPEPPEETPGPVIRPVEFRPRRGDDPATGRRARRRGRRAESLLLVPLLLGLAAVAAFVFLARPVEVTVEPEPDRLALEDSWPAPRVGGRWLLLPGEHALVAELEGYRPLETILEVRRGGPGSFRFRLEPLPGRLALDLTPAAGVQVLVDGEQAGVTPLEAPLELAPGTHTLRLRAPRHRQLVEEVEIRGRGEVQTLRAELVPAWAPVTFRSEPAGARVRLDGTTVGTTPLTADVGEGRHDYELVLRGFKPHRAAFRVVAGEPRTLPRVELAPSDGNLTVVSEPAGATVTVDGEYRGTTPLDLELAPGAAHRVEVSRAGHESFRRQVTLEPGETRELTALLETEEGEVVISAFPPDARVRVNGEDRGPARQTLRLSTVAHEIEIVKDGYAPYSTTLTPLAGVPQSIEVTLESRGEVHKAAAPPVLESPEGHTLVRIEPGRFRMGAPRREPGRRSNEVLREVELTRPFYLATREVTNRQLRRFREGHRSGQVAGHNLEIDHHPAVRLDWRTAAAYCNWLSRKEGLSPAYVERGGRLMLRRPVTAGYRLPTEAEWAWAARFPRGQGSGPKKYPWGDALPVAPGSGNYADRSARGFLPSALPDYRDGFPTTAPVDAFPPDARGIHQLGGNAAEWVHDVYAVAMPGSGAGDDAVERDPLGPAPGEVVDGASDDVLHVIRGSSWMHGTVTELRLSFRDFGSEPRPDVGFRIARYLDTPDTEGAP